jgi:hypothetical protein
LKYHFFQSGDLLLHMMILTILLQTYMLKELYASK